MKAWRSFPIRFSAGPVPRGPRRWQPSLESLEGRVVLSTLHPVINVPRPITGPVLELPVPGGIVTTGGESGSDSGDHPK